MSLRRAEVPAILALHGIPPDADEATLLAELEARGWDARVEEREESGRHRQPLYRALALRRRPPPAAGRRPSWASDHRQGSGQTAARALAQVLAAVLARED